MPHREERHTPLVATRTHAIVKRMALTGALMAGLQVARAQQAAAVVEEPAAPANQSDFVLSLGSFAAHFSVKAKIHSSMAFVEDLFAIQIPTFFAFFIIFAFAIVLATIVPLLFDEILRRFQAPRNYRTCFELTLKLIIVIFGLGLALDAIGISLTEIIFSFGVLAIGISSGITLPVSNISSGLTEQATNFVHIGDVIRIGENTITVTEMGLFNVFGVNARGAKVKVPNHYFSQYSVENLTDVPELPAATITTESHAHLGALRVRRSETNE